MKLRKLTKQFSGGTHFRHIVEFTLKDCQQFVDIRQWCWEQWGPSCELEYWFRTGQSNPRWCWMSDNHGRIRIYMASDAETTLFTLKWL